MEDSNGKQLPEIRIGTMGTANFIGFRPDIREYSDPIADMLHEISSAVSDRTLVDNDGTQYRELGFRANDGKPAHYIGNVALNMALGLGDSRSDSMSFSEVDVKDMSKGARLF